MVDLNAAADLDAIELEADTVARLFVELGTTAAEFAAWLGGNANGLDAATARITRVIEKLTPGGEETLVDTGPPIGHGYANVYHLGVLLRLCMPSLGERPLLQAVPAPPERRCRRVWKLFASTSDRKREYARTVAKE